MVIGEAGDYRKQELDFYDNVILLLFFCFSEKEFYNIL